MEKRRVLVNATQCQNNIKAHITALNVNVAKPENVKNSALLALRRKTCALAQVIAIVNKVDAGTLTKRKEKSAR